jgi:hypothetical protein
MHSDAANDEGDAADAAAHPDSMTDGFPQETEVRPGEAVAAECRYCGRPFATERKRDLHVGEVHDADCTDEERAAYEAASEAERDELFYFHLKVVAALGVLYSAVVLVYMVALGSGLL